MPMTQDASYAGDDAPAAYPDDRPLSLVTVASYDEPSFAHLARLRLEREDIPCTIDDEYLPAVQWFYSNAIGGTKLRVPLEQAQRAAQVLARPPQPSAPPEPEDVTCPRCGCTDVYRPHLSRGWTMLGLLVLGIPIPIPGIAHRCARCAKTWRPRPPFPIGGEIDGLLAFPVVMAEPSTPGADPPPQPLPHAAPPPLPRPSEAVSAPALPVSTAPVQPSVAIQSDAATAPAITEDPPPSGSALPWAVYAAFFLIGCLASSSLYSALGGRDDLLMFHVAGFATGAIVLALMRRGWLRNQPGATTFLVAFLCGVLEFPCGWVVLWVVGSVMGRNGTQQWMPPPP